jgi:lysophospholipid acyltransferase (LPLAT)-like uncharacterized protein
MKLRNKGLIRFVAFAAAVLIRGWMSTVRIIRVVNRDTTKHPADASNERFIYAFWHECLLVPVKFQARVSVLISLHADGELIAQVCRHLGFGVVRGSTTRGGSSALVELWDCSQRSHLVFTPDGPRGPRRKVQMGAIVLASRTGLPVVPLGFAFQQAWRARSWDRFAVPKPFTGCFCVVEKAVHVPAEADREAMEGYRRLVEERMLEATRAAENLAQAGWHGPHRAKGVAVRRERSADPSR